MLLALSMLLIAGCGGSGRQEASGDSEVASAGTDSDESGGNGGSSSSAGEAGPRTFALSPPDQMTAEPDPGDSPAVTAAGRRLPPLAFRPADLHPVSDHAVGLLADPLNPRTVMAQRVLDLLATALSGEQGALDAIADLSAPESIEYLQAVIRSGPRVPARFAARVGEFRSGAGGRSRASVVLRTDVPSESVGEIVLRSVDGQLLLEDLLIDLSQLAVAREPSALEPRGYSWYFQTP